MIVSVTNASPGGVVSAAVAPTSVAVQTRQLCAAGALISEARVVATQNDPENAASLAVLPALHLFDEFGVSRAEQIEDIADALRTTANVVGIVVRVEDGKTGVILVHNRCHLLLYDMSAKKNKARDAITNLLKKSRGVDRDRKPRVLKVVAVVVEETQQKFTQVLALREQGAVLTMLNLHQAHHQARHSEAANATGRWLIQTVHAQQVLDHCDHNRQQGELCLPCQECINRPEAVDLLRRNVDVEASLLIREFDDGDLGRLDDLAVAIILGAPAEMDLAEVAVSLQQICKLPHLGEGAESVLGLPSVEETVRTQDHVHIRCREVKPRRVRPEGIHFCVSIFPISAHDALDVLDELLTNGHLKGCRRNKSVKVVDLEVQAKQVSGTSVVSGLAGLTVGPHSQHRRAG